MTLAIWTSAGSGMDNNTVAPATDSPRDWNVWAKYFDGIIVNDTTHTAAVTAFHTDVYGLNLETVIIPTDIDIDGVMYKVVEIRNSVFADTTLKQLPVTIYIPPTVTYINAMSFASLSNLTKVVFGVDENGAGDACVVDDYAFMMCSKLTTVVTNGRSLTGVDGSALSASSNAFTGCSSSIAIVTGVSF